MGAAAGLERPRALEDALNGYAAGSLPRALHALVGAHLELSCENREFVATLERSLAAKDLGAEDNGDAAPFALRAGKDRLAAILEKVPLPRDKCCREPLPGWPRALRHYLGDTPEKLPFRTLLPGIAECRLSGDDNAEALLYKVRGGKTIPEHVHQGEEFTLVLSGALLDRGRRYCPGDVNIGDDSVQHAPVAAPGQECVCFVVLTGPLRLTGPIGRFFNRFMRNS